MRQYRGFTLLEVIVVIVLVGVLAAGAGMLISRPIEAYSDQLRRQQLVDSAEMALRKIATDIRRALPNSIRIIDNGPTGWALEMVNTVDGARYRDEAGGAGFNSANEILEFSAAENGNFNLLGRFSNLASGVAYSNLRVVVYNTSPADIYTDAFNGSNPGIITPAGFTLTDIGNEQHVTLDTPFQFALQSPAQRLFVVDGAVSYICDSVSGALTRVDGYPDQLVQIGALIGFPPSANSSRVASQVSACDISYQPGTAQRGGLITLDIALANAQGEGVRLLHQVHVDNVP